MDTLLDFLPLIIIAAIATFSRIQKGKKQGQGAWQKPFSQGQPPRGAGIPGILQTLQKRLEEAKQRAALQEEQSIASQSPGDTLLLRRGQSEEEENLPPLPLDESLADFSLHPPIIKEEEWENPSERGQAMPIPQPLAKGKDNESQMMSQAHYGLKQAIIWSEILAPPITLRRNHLERD